MSQEVGRVSALIEEDTRAPVTADHIAEARTYGRRSYTDADRESAD